MMSFFPSLLVGGLVCFHLGWGGGKEGEELPSRAGDLVGTQQSHPRTLLTDTGVPPAPGQPGLIIPIATGNLQVQEETRVQPKAGLASKQRCKAQLQPSVQPLQKRLHFGVAFLLYHLKTLSAFSVRSIGH